MVFNPRLFVDGMTMEDRDSVHSLQVAWYSAQAAEIVRTQDRREVLRQFEDFTPSVLIPLPLPTRFEGDHSTWMKAVATELSEALALVTVPPTQPRALQQSRGPLPDYLPFGPPPNFWPQADGPFDQPGPSGEIPPPWSAQRLAQPEPRKAPAPAPLGPPPGFERQRPQQRPQQRPAKPGKAKGPARQPSASRQVTQVERILLPCTRQV